MNTPLRSPVIIAVGIVLGLAFAAAADQRSYQTANMFDFGNPAIMMPGGATLVRSKQTVEMRIATSGLDTSSSYTVWWVVFNNPAACVGGCGEDDLEVPAVRASAFYAAGFVTGMGNDANVSARLEAGKLPRGLEVLFGGGLEPGNGTKAEIHLIVRSHGLTSPGSVDQQIGSFDGGCNPACVDQQAVIFPPTP